MKKLSIFLGLLVALSLVLTACGPAENENNENNGTLQPGATEEVGLETGTPALPETGNETPMVTLAPTEAITTSLGTSEPTATPSMMETATPGAAITGTQEVTGTPGIPSTSFVDISRVSVLLDLPVKDTSGEKLGEVGDLVLNLRTMCLDYLVLSPESSLALENDQVAIPWQAVSVNGEASSDTDQALVVNTSLDTLKSAPGFAKDGKPNLTSEGWDMELRNFWTDNISGTQTTTGDTSGKPGANCGLLNPGQSGTANETTLNRSVMAKEFIGTDVQDSQGNSLGEIEDVIVDVGTGAIRYFVISAGGFLGIGEKLIPVPLGAFKYTGEKDEFITLNVSSDVLTKAPTFDADKLPDARMSGWDTDIMTYWDQQDLQGGAGSSSTGGLATATPTKAP